MDEEVVKKIDKFFKQFKNQTYRKGEILIRPDDDPTGIFYLTKGYVKEYAITKKGDEIMLNIFRPISYFPMSWAINNTPNEHFYEAMTELSVWKAPRNDVLAFIKSEPDVLYDLISRVYRGMDGLLMRMTYLMAGNAYSRLIMELVIQTKRLGKKEGKTYKLQLSEKEIAAESGMTRETVSREMKILKKKGLVTFLKKTLIIKDLHALEKELSEEV
ncbi:MAG: Crp/Fnr family transcriptional regulator [Actinobacteria bacterium]|nr:Crp/Fnr family transcriptional regulator [Actinomycetota bacterium]